MLRFQSNRVIEIEMLPSCESDQQQRQKLTAATPTVHFWGQAGIRDCNTASLSFSVGKLFYGSRGISQKMKCI